ncbi:1,6-anhydro-N-acetylmuramyl-L-alanine amidase AmpD [Duganella sp. HH105]|uniref:1,6-anhydro-N-acetylmuramyl-L-alanine amidase AmpD n=1 Tax=Duganella sp. HH105 TaxID=1781067 RepID=UPI000877E94E|nr:1,6-anhydro-N-acetylmuramyl-L-alanine amidase AmpD [Duganella sp. HH105]OEZ58932.1 1,6-anhydro-N-acetylmuramyl-L-alanine amidase AmpD [Duganella sp. HH105]
MSAPPPGADGWWPQAIRYDSPHADDRPDPADITLLVVHNISLPGGSYGGPHVSDLFTGRLDYNTDPSFADLRGLKVSSHFFIRRDGRVMQYVSANDRAWHAGLSVFRGREKCNDYSIGVELEGTDDSGFEPAQYEALAALTLALQSRYPLTDVQGHEHIAPGRKTDPGPLFDWEFYQKSWQTLLNQKALDEPALVGASAGLRFAKGLLQSQ